MNSGRAIVPPNVRWIGRRLAPTVLFVDDQRGEFKRKFAATLLGYRAEKGITSQRELGVLVGISEATAQRWEDPDKPHLPDAWEVARLCEVLDREPGDFIRPEDWTPREREMARRAARGARRAIDRERQAS